MRLKRTYLLLLGLGLYLCLQAGGIAWSQVTDRVSVNSAGVEGNNASSTPSNSSDGRYVAFESFATNLVVGDLNGFFDVFVHDRQTGATIRVSLHTDGTEGDRDSNDPSISADGRYVAFESFASTLVAGDTPFPFGFPDIFVRDRDADGNGTYDEAGGVSTVRVSVDSDGIAWDGPSLNPSISTNGRYVAFDSDAGLVVDDTLVAPDVFVHDRDYDEDGIYDDEDGTYDTGEVSTVRVSVRSDGTEADQNSSAPSISLDGRYVAFESFATNLVAGDLNGLFDVFVHDRDADGDGIYDEAGAISTVRVSVRSDGTEADQASAAASISGDGRYVAFVSDATNLVVGDLNGFFDVFVHDLQTGATTRVSVDSAGVEGNGISNFPSISDDGRYVAFESLSTNLVADDNNGSADVFVHDRDADGNGAYDEPGGISTVRVSVDLDGVQGNGNSNAPSMSADGKSVTFQSGADNLVAGDTNTALDIFVDDLQAAAGGGGGGGSSSGGGGCFISTAVDGSRMAGEVK